MPLIPIADYIYSLEFTSKPDYNRIKFYFTKNLLDQEMIPNNLYDWNQNAFRGNQSQNYHSPKSYNSNSQSSMIDSFNMMQINKVCARSPLLSNLRFSEESFDSKLGKIAKEFSNSDESEYDNSSSGEEEVKSEKIIKRNFGFRRRLDDEENEEVKEMVIKKSKLN